MDQQPLRRRATIAVAPLPQEHRDRNEGGVPEDEEQEQIARDEGRDQRCEEQIPEREVRAPVSHPFRRERAGGEDDPGERDEQRAELVEIDGGAGPERARPAEAQRSAADATEDRERERRDHERRENGGRP